MKSYIERWSLQLFGEGGEGAAAPAGDGGQAQQVEEQPQKASFDDLLKDPDYAKEFEKRSNRAAYNARKQAQAERSKYNQMYEALGRKYGLDVSDPNKIDMDKLSAAVMADDALFEREATEMGVTVDGLRKIRAAEDQMREADRIRAEEESRRAWQQLVQDGEQLKQLYPGFDLEAELSNPQFGKLLAGLQASGFDGALRTAYESVHRDEIMSGVLQHAVQKTKQQVSNSIQAGQRRPAEAGAAAAVQTHIDPANLSKEQRKELRERVMRGEIIRF
jgi:hypothetical protein